MTILELQRRAHQTSIDKGWWDDQAPSPDGRTILRARHLTEAVIPEKLCLIHSEVSEALEEHRNGHAPTEIYYTGEKPEGIGIELADVVIRVLDLCGALGIDLEGMIELKMTYNATRPHRHGGKRI